MKKLFFLVASVLSVALAFQSCQKPDTPEVPVGPQTVAVTGVSVSASSVELTEGGTQTINVTVSPSNATDKTVSFSSDNTSVATVDSNGKITAVGPGTATITVTTKDGNKTAKVTVTVAAAAVKVESVTLDKDKIELTAGESAALSASVLPVDASNKSVTWSSSDETVVTVDQKGVLAAVAEGTATITVTTADGGKTASCEVTVKELAVEGITIEPAAASLMEGTTLQLTAKVSPADASQEVEWASQNPDVATVDMNTGLVTAVSPGTVRIVARSKSFTDKQAVCEITVTQDTSLKGIQLSASALNLEEGEVSTISVSFIPSYAANKKVTWSSSDESVARVDNSGTVTAIANGTAIITATAQDGGHTATCEVTVSESEGPKVYHFKMFKTGIFVDNKEDPRNFIYDQPDFTLKDVRDITSFGNTLYSLEKYFKDIYLCINRKPTISLLSDSRDDYTVLGFKANSDFFAVLLVYGETVYVIKGNYDGNVTMTTIQGSFYRMYHPTLALAPDGTAQVAARIEDTFGKDWLATYTLSGDDAVEERLVCQNNDSEPVVMATESGDFYIVDYKKTTDYQFNTVVVYKNGEELYTLDKADGNLLLSGFWSNGHVYFALNDRTNGEIRVYKDQTLVETISSDYELWAYNNFANNALYVSDSGSIYISVRKGVDYDFGLFKDGKLLYNSTEYMYFPYAVIE